MTFLAGVLEHASSRSAFELLIESGQPVVLTTVNGTEHSGEVVSEAELFEALTEVLGPDQQVDLAVGNMVEFSLNSSRDVWTLVTDSGADGIFVHGHLQQDPRRTARMPIVASPVKLEIPPLEPFVPMPSPAVEAPAILAAIELETQRERPPTPARESSNGAMQEDAVEDASDDAILLDNSALDLSDGTPAQASTDMYDPTARSWSLDLAAAFMDDASSEMRDAAPATQPRHATLQMRSHGTVAVDTGTSELVELASEIEPGMLCFVHGDGVAAQLGDFVGAPLSVIDERSSVATLDEIRSESSGVGACVVVVLDDPSVHLGWLLRRVEEGWRVLLETRARTPDGALRILLGTNAGERATKWLDAIDVRWLVRHDGHWRFFKRDPPA